MFAGRLFLTFVFGTVSMLTSKTISARHAYGLPRKFSLSYCNASEPSIKFDPAMTVDLDFFRPKYCQENGDTENNMPPKFAFVDTINQDVESFSQYLKLKSDPEFTDTLGDKYRLPDSLIAAKRNITLGASLLTAEYIILPTIAYYTWWKEGFIWDNPLNYIGEREPFFADNAWHMAGCNMLTEFHYRVMNGCFRSRHSVLFSTSLTLFTFTVVECLDALEKTQKWEFSLGDAFANVLGVGFWTYKHYYPNSPISVRVGIRKWRDAIDLLEEAATAITDFDKFQGGDFDHYSILKVEGIYRFKPGLYCGVAISRKDAPSDENLWGITVGWDLIKALDKKGTRKSLLHTISEYVSIPISFTYWLD